MTMSHAAKRNFLDIDALNHSRRYTNHFIEETTDTDWRIDQTSHALFGLSMNRVLSTPELLALIFGFNSKGDSTGAARVCRIWKEPALDYIWKTLDGPKPLACLLVPLVLKNGGGERLVRS